MLIITTCQEMHNAFQTYSLPWLDQSGFWAGNFPKHQQETTLNILQGLNRERKSKPTDSHSSQAIIFPQNSVQWNIANIYLNVKSLVRSVSHCLFCSFLLLVELLYITFSKSCMDLIMFSSWWKKRETFRCKSSVWPHRGSRIFLVKLDLKYTSMWLFPHKNNKKKNYILNVNITCQITLLPDRCHWNKQSGSVNSKKALRVTGFESLITLHV